MTSRWWPMAQRPQAARGEWEGELFRLLAENVKDYAIFVVDELGRVRTWNVGAERLLGYGEQEIVGQSGDVFFTPEDIERGVPQQEMRDSLNEGRGNDDRWHVRKDGSRFWSGGMMTPLWDEGRKLRGFAKIMRDRTEWKRHQDARDEQVRLAAFIKAVGLALIQTDSLHDMLRHCAQTMVQHLNGAFARIWTLNADENVLELQASAGLYTHLDGAHGRVPVGQYKIGLIAHERRPHLTNAVVGDPRVNDQTWAREEGMVAFAGYPLIVDGRVVGVMAMFARQPLSEATLEAMASVANEIALGIERKVTDERRREQQEWMRVTVASIGDAVIATDTSGRVVFLNAVAKDLTGWTQGDAHGQSLETVFAILHEQTREPVENPVDKVLREGVIVGLGNHTVLVARDGTERPIDDSAAPIRDATGAMIGVVLIFRDVTEQRRAEHELRASEARKSAILDTALDCIITMDHQGSIVEFNPAAEKTFGYTRTDVIGHELASLIIPQRLRERHRLGMVHFLATGDGPVLGKRIALPALRADGTEFPVELAITRISLEGPPLFTAYVRDVTERTRTERYRNARLIVTQVLSKAPSIGVCASGILQAICENLGWELGLFWIPGPQADFLRCAESWHLPGVETTAFETLSRTRTFHRGEGLPGQAWATGEPIWILDVIKEPNFPRRAPAAQGGLHGAFACPVVLAGETLGVIEFFSREIRKPDADLLELMDTVCGQTSQFIERKQAEEHVLRSEQELADFFENATVGLHWVGADGTILRANRAELDMLGYNHDEYVGRPITEFHVDEDVICDILTRLQAGEKLNEYPARLRCKDGSIKDVLIDSSVMWKEDQFVHTRCFTRDVTERKIAEAKVREQEQRTQTILESITDAFCALDRDWRFTYVNRQAEILMARDRDDLLGRNHWEEYPDTIGTDVERNFKRALAENITITFEFFFPPHDRWYDIHAYPSPTGLSVYFRDVSERRQAESALRESEENLRLLADTIPQLTWMARPDGYIFWYNKQWYEYTGTTPDQMEGWGWQSVHDPEALPTVLERWRASIASGVPFDMVFPLKGADGSFRPFLTRVNPLRDARGRILYWFGTNTDITEQVQAEKALRRSESHQRFLSDISAALVGSLHYQSILRQVADKTVPTLGDICFFDVLAHDDTLERVGWKHVDPTKTHVLERMRGLLPSIDAEHHPVSRAIRTGRPDVVRDVTEEWLRNIATSSEHLQLLRDLELSSVVTVPMLVGERRLGALTFCYSASGRNHTPEELALAEEIARRVALTVENAKLYDELRATDRRKDEFLATLAHELRNPLAPIHNSLQILKMARVDAATAKQTRDMMERQLQHLVRLVDDLLDVSRVMRGKIELRKELVELASVVARAVETAQPLIEVRSHELTISLPPESLVVNVDPVRLAQVFGNLLTNAAKYTEPHGRISLEAERDGDHAVLRIQDNGIGIAHDMLPKVFDLFVQVDHAATRSQGGLGVGLTLVKNLVEMHDGTVTAHSAGLGKGSEFVVRLPLSTEEPKEAVPEVDQPSATIASGYRLLVVDDNRDAAVSLAMLLRAQGHDVQSVYDGPSALELLRTYRPHMVFLDIGMPGMDGYEVARRIRKHPELRHIVVVALTGWGQQEDRRRSAEAGFDHHLVKPPDQKALEAVLVCLTQTF